MIVLGTQMKKELMGNADAEACVRMVDFSLENNVLCATPCVFLSTTVSNCLDDCGFDVSASGSTATAITEYGVTCSERYLESNQKKCEFDCLYDGYTFNLDCDSTDGLDYNTKGTSTNYYGLYVEEFCFNSDILEEFYCESNRIRSEEYTCPNGCLDGACIGGGVPYTNFISAKNSYLSSSSFSTFILNANSWINA